MIVKLIYDHRVLDGAYVARRLRDVEEVLNGPILDELRENRATPGVGQAAESPSNVEPLLKPHLLTREGEAPAEPSKRSLC